MHSFIHKFICKCLPVSYYKTQIHIYVHRLCIHTRGLRAQHLCYPTRTRSTGPLAVPIPDPYSKLLPDPARPRGYTRTRHCQAFPCIVYVPTRLIGLQLGSSYSLINRLMMIMMMKYCYINTAKKEEGD